MSDAISILGLEDTRNTLLKLEDAITPSHERMELIGQVMYDSAHLNFDVGGRPGWAPLAASTLLRKGKAGVRKQTRAKFKKLSRSERASAFRSFGAGNKILIDEGELLGSIAPSAGEDYAKVATNVFYGRFHEFGTIKMPQRKFLAIQDEDEPEIERILLEPIDEAIA